jgi:uncharacterized protein (TIGR00369 family)
MTNPDQGLLRSFDPACGKPLAIDSSPFALALGAQLHRLDRERGLIELHFTPGEQFLQGAQVIQGGAVTAMLDFAMGFAGLAAVGQGQTIATATINVAFLRAAKAGTYLAIGEIERKGRNLIFTQGRLFQPGAEPVASATSTLLVVG